MGVLAKKQTGTNSRNANAIVGSLSERNKAAGTEMERTPAKLGATFDQGVRPVASPRLGLTVKGPRKGGGMAARRGKLNLSGVPGLGTGGSKLDFIHHKADELAAMKHEQESKCFDSQYMLDDPPKVLGQGMHATVYKCYKKSDASKSRPFAVKVAREADEEKRMAHAKEFKIAHSLSHGNVAKATEYFFNELTEEIHLVMEYVEG